MKKIAMLLLVGLVVFQSTGFAKLVSGKLEAVDAAANSISITSKDPATGAEEKVEIKVKPETVFTGATNLAELKAGEEVWVEANQNAETQAWEATSVKTAGASAAAASY